MATVKDQDRGSQAVKVSTKGWVVIPFELRRRYGIEPGQRIQIVDYGGVLSLVPDRLADPVEEARGALAGESSLTEALLAERRRERRREKAHEEG